jgi:hypothetical protein
MVNEDTEMWKEFRRHKQAKKRSNLAYSTDYLTKHDIPYESHNMGVHLVVDSRVDFWPSTGKWIVRGGGKTGRGLMGLIKWLNQ